MPPIAASIALAPFENLSGDPSQDVLALGIVEDVASALSMKTFVSLSTGTRIEFDPWLGARIVVFAPTPGGTHAAYRPQ